MATDALRAFLAAADDGDEIVINGQRFRASVATRVGLVELRIATRPDADADEAPIMLPPSVVRVYAEWSPNSHG